MTGKLKLSIKDSQTKPSYPVNGLEMKVLDRMKLDEEIKTHTERGGGGYLEAQPCVGGTA